MYNINRPRAVLNHGHEWSVVKLSSVETEWVGTSQCHPPCGPEHMNMPNYCYHVYCRQLFARPGGGVQDHVMVMSMSL